MNPKIGILTKSFSGGTTKAIQPFLQKETSTRFSFKREHLNSFKDFIWMPLIIRFLLLTARKESY